MEYGELCINLFAIVKWDFENDMKGKQIKFTFLTLLLDIHLPKYIVGYIHLLYFWNVFSIQHLMKKLKTL